MTAADKSNNNDSPAKKMGLGWLTAAVIFLFNPCLNIIDVLPDFFGCVFLIIGLRKWADLCPAIADALQGLEKLRWFLLVKAFAMILVPLNDDTFVLVMTFGFAVIEMIYLYPAIGRIFNGFEYFATRFQGRSVYVNYRSVTSITYIFCVGKAILTVLPELCSLSDYEYDGYVTGGVQFNIADYKSALLILSLFLVTLMGLMWLVNIIPYIKRISSETDFLERVAAQYELEIASNDGLTLKRRLRTIILLITAGTVFTMNIWLDEFNVIPGFIGGIFLLIGSLRLKKLSDTAKPAIIASAVYTGCSALSYALSIIFAANYTLTDVMHRFEAYDLYNYTRVGSILEYVSLFAAIFLIIREFRGLIRVYLAPDSRISDKRLVNIYHMGQKELDRRFVISLVLFVLSFAFNFALALFRAEITAVVSEFWWIPLILTVIWIIYQKSTSDALYDQIEQKYI